jgi:hypothetical protein
VLAAFCQAARTAVRVVLPRSPRSGSLVQKTNGLLELEVSGMDSALSHHLVIFCSVGLGY